MSYNHELIEQKWKKYWEDNKTYSVKDHENGKENADSRYRNSREYVIFQMS